MSNEFENKKTRISPDTHTAGGGLSSSDSSSFDPTITLVGYDKDRYIEVTVNEIADLDQYLHKFAVTWLHISGVRDTPFLSELSRNFSVHPLALEDIVNPQQRAKVEYYENHTFIVLRMLSSDEPPATEQLSMFIGEGYVLTFEHSRRDCFSTIREKIRQGSGIVRTHGPEYLCYTIVDAVIDEYFPVLEKHEDALELLEDEILEQPNSKSLPKVHQIKRELLLIERAIWPLPEALNSLLLDSSPFSCETTRAYFMNCHDHSLRIIDLTRSYRQLAKDLMDVYLSSVNNKMNDVIKFLTVISTIFIPPTFVAAVYGMNFSTAYSPWNMPELNWYLGYPLCLLVMAAMTLGMIFYLKSKGWIGPPLS